ncbi:hypothetical protein QR680_018593 [Steinernema hermaphroditum]|uniref:Uncharacterized protein n=1 Tax=Steinernema hermaphroditum TaxID=289476 RepID=A0AA39LR01_9BILA|nr:hypothetical protein QR680_018593 [Steinernema hermaphroditum]
MSTRALIRHHLAIRDSALQFGLPDTEKRQKIFLSSAAMLVRFLLAAIAFVLALKAQNPGVAGAAALVAGGLLTNALSNDMAACYARWMQRLRGFIASRKEAAKKWLTRNFAANPISPGFRSGLKDIPDTMRLIAQHRAQLHAFVTSLPPLITKAYFRSIKDNPFHHIIVMHYRQQKRSRPVQSCCTIT